MASNNTVKRKTPNLTWKENPGLAIPSPSFKPQSLSINNWNNILQAYWRPQEVSSALQDATGEHLHMSEWSAFPPASPVLQDNPGPCKHHQNFSRRCNDAHMYPPTVCVCVCVCTRACNHRRLWSVTLAVKQGIEERGKNKVLRDRRRERYLN